MKNETRLTKRSLIALHVVFALLGSLVAAVTYYRYTAIARAIVGIAFVYVVLNRNAFESLHGSIEVQLLRPNKPKAFLTTFLAATVSTWSVMQVAEAAIFYLRR